MENDPFIIALYTLSEDIAAEQELLDFVHTAGGTTYSLRKTYERFQEKINRLILERREDTRFIETAPYVAEWAAEMLDDSVSAIAPRNDHAKYGDFEGEGAADPWKAVDRYIK